MKLESIKNLFKRNSKKPQEQRVPKEILEARQYVVEEMSKLSPEEQKNTSYFIPGDGWYS